MGIHSPQGIGFSGVAAVFKPHQEREISRTSTTRELLSRQTKRFQWASALQKFHDAFRRLGCARLLQAASTTGAASCNHQRAECGAALKPHLRTVWRDHQDLEQLHRLRIEHQLKSVPAAKTRQTRQNDLGTPCPRLFMHLDEEL